MPRLKVREIAEAQGLNMSQLQRKSGVTMPSVRRYWYNLIRAGRLDMPYIPAVASKNPEALIEGARHPVTMMAVARLRGVAVGTRMALGTAEDGTEAPVCRQAGGRLVCDGHEVVEAVELAEDVALITEAGTMVLMDSALYGALSRC